MPAQNLRIAARQLVEEKPPRVQHRTFLVRQIVTKKKLEVAIIRVLGGSHLKPEEVGALPSWSGRMGNTRNKYQDEIIIVDADLLQKTTCCYP